MGNPPNSNIGKLGKLFQQSRGEESGKK